MSLARLRIEDTPSETDRRRDRRLFSSNGGISGKSLVDSLASPASVSSCASPPSSQTGANDVVVVVMKLPVSANDERMKATPSDRVARLRRCLRSCFLSSIPEALAVPLGVAASVSSRGARRPEGINKSSCVNASDFFTLEVDKVVGGGKINLEGDST